MKDQCQTGKLHTIFGSTILWCYFEFYIPVFTFNLCVCLCLFYFSLFGCCKD